MFVLVFRQRKSKPISTDAEGSGRWNLGQGGRGDTLKKYQRKYRGCFDYGSRCILHGNSTQPLRHVRLSVIVLLPWRHIGGLEIRIHLFLTLALDGGEWWLQAQTSSPGPRTPAPITQEAGWALRASLDVLEYRKIVCPLTRFKTERSSDVPWAVTGIHDSFFERWT
jgi:hypothetical protein